MGGWVNQCLRGQGVGVTGVYWVLCACVFQTRDEKIGMKKDQQKTNPQWNFNPFGVLSLFNTWGYQNSSFSLYFNRKKPSVFFPLELRILFVAD